MASGDRRTRTGRLPRRQPAVVASIGYHVRSRQCCQDNVWTVEPNNGRVRHRLQSTTCEMSVTWRGFRHEADRMHRGTAIYADDLTAGVLPRVLGLGWEKGPHVFFQAGQQVLVFRPGATLKGDQLPARSAARARRLGIHRRFDGGGAALATMWRSSTNTWEPAAGLFIFATRRKLRRAVTPGVWGLAAGTRQEIGARIDDRRLRLHRNLGRQAALRGRRGSLDLRP